MIDLSYLLKNNINTKDILSVILTGGVKYDTSDNHKDIDFFVILNKDIKFLRLYDDENKIDYLCFGKEYIYKLINNEDDHFNKPYILLDLCNQEEHLKYGKICINNNLFDNQIKIKEYYKKWLTKKNNNILKNLTISKNLFYAFVLMYYIKNNKYELTDEQQDIVNKVHKKKPINEKEQTEFVDFYELDEEFKIEFKLLNEYYKTNKNKEEKHE